MLTSFSTKVLVTSRCQEIDSNEKSLLKQAQEELIGSSNKSQRYQKRIPRMLDSFSTRCYRNRLAEESILITNPF